MGIVKIDDGLQEDARRASTVMFRSINAQAVAMRYAAAPGSAPRVLAA